MAYKDALNSAIIAPEHQQAFDDALPLLYAAPNLLEALQGMLEIFVDSDQLSDCEDMQTVIAARKAINLAKGL